MVMKSTDDVLADLKRVGAVGGQPKTSALFETVVTEVEIEQGPPSVALRDLRGGRTVEAVDEAIAYLDDVMRGLEGVRGALSRLRRVWEPIEEDEESPEMVLETPETVLGGQRDQEATSPSHHPQRVADGLQEPDEEALALAREAARRKILGQDIPSGQLAAEEEAEDVPFVGTVRALPPGQEPEEITIGTVGTIKPSFPVEESNGT